MAGIYIPGIEMPKDKAVAVVIHPDGTAYTAEMFAGVCTEYLADCTAVPVPPHGRLIDADALMAEFEKAERTMEQHGREYACSFMSSSQEISTEWYCVEDMLENAPTIIPAEEGE